MIFEFSRGFIVLILYERFFFCCNYKNLDFRVPISRLFFEFEFSRAYMCIMFEVSK